MRCPSTKKWQIEAKLKMTTFWKENQLVPNPKKKKQTNKNKNKKLATKGELMI
jgi:hypothetical protein